MGTTTDLTFVLTSGGHNAGIVSEPGHRHRSYQMGTRKNHDAYGDPDTWRASIPIRKGSWWPEWQSCSDQLPTRPRSLNAQVQP